MPTRHALAHVPRPLAEYVARGTIALCVADPRLPDCPLVAVNPAFCGVTLYAPEDVLGRNCRMLQPPGGPGPVRARMREFLVDPRADEARFLVPNVRRDGTPFLNLVYMAKLARDGATELILGSQFDLTRHRAGQEVYDAALAHDLRELALSLRGTDGLIVGSLDMLARSQRLLAQAIVG